MTKREFRKKLMEGGAQPKLARMLAESAEWIFYRVRKAEKMKRDGKHAEAEAVTHEIARWLNGMNAFAETMAEMLTEDDET